MSDVARSPQDRSRRRRDAADQHAAVDSESLDRAPSWASGLVVGRPDDAAEKDADRAAGRPHRPHPGGAPTTADPRAVRDAVDSSGRSLEPGEGGHVPGVDRSAVRVHSGPAAAASARALGAAAYTVGHDVVLGGGLDPRSARGRGTMAHELAHVAQHRPGGPVVVHRDLAIEPTRTGARDTLTDTQAADAAAFNRRTITDAAEIRMLRDILGLEPDPPAVDEEFSAAVASFQAGIRGVTIDGKVGGTTRRRLSQEILAEEQGLGPAAPGGLLPGLRLRNDLTALVGAGNTTYADYRSRIVAASPLARDVCLTDQAFLRDLRAALAWNDFARCVELFGRRPPTFATLIADGRVTAALRRAWTDSNPAVRGAGAPPAPGQQEQGGWIFLDLVTGDLAVRRAAGGGAAAINLSNPPTLADSVVVAMFHTHPNLGPDWDAGPSPADVRLDTRDAVPDIVVGTPGIDPAVFQTFQSGPDRRAHLAGPRGLPRAGALAPQARADGSVGPEEER